MGTTEVPNLRVSLRRDRDDVSARLLFGDVLYTIWENHLVLGPGATALTYSKGETFETSAMYVGQKSNHAHGFQIRRHRKPALGAIDDKWRIEDVSVSGWHVEMDVDRMPSVSNQGSPRSMKILRHVGFPYESCQEISEDLLRGFQNGYNWERVEAIRAKGAALLESMKQQYPDAYGLQRTA